MKDVIQYINNNLVTIILVIVVFRSARKMGYSGLLWGIVSFLYSPLVFLYLLAALPNRKLDQKRDKEMQLLKVQLEQARLRGRKINSTIGSNITIGEQGTISDDKTID